MSDLIDRQAAIEGFESVTWHDPRDTDIAHEVIGKLPSVHPTQNNTFNTLKALDCISRQAAIDYCYALINAENQSDPSDEWNYSQERINQTEVILHHLEFMPSAQPEVAKDINVPINDCVSRQAMFETVAEYEKQLREIYGDENELVETVKILKHRLLIELPSAQPEPHEIGYLDCSNALLKMWIDNVLTDGEYKRIAGRLKERWDG